MIVKQDSVTLTVSQAHPRFQPGALCQYGGDTWTLTGRVERDDGRVDLSLVRWLHAADS